MTYLDHPIPTDDHDATLLEGLFQLSVSGGWGVGPARPPPRPPQRPKLGFIKACRKCCSKPGSISSMNITP